MYANIDKPELRNGPGYPLAIFLLVLFNAPYILIKMLNVVFLIGAVLFFNKTISFYTNPKKSNCLWLSIGTLYCHLKMDDIYPF